MGGTSHHPTWDNNVGIEWPERATCGLDMWRLANDIRSLLYAARGKALVLAMQNATGKVIEA